jgi:hypothetical protein
MGILVECSRCAQAYGRVFLDAAESPRCRCGAALDPAGDPPRFVDRAEVWAEERRLSELARAADQLCFLIVATDTPRVDVDIQRSNLRRRCKTLFPDKMDLYDMVYESRFRRLWEQFRAV